MQWASAFLCLTCGRCKERGRTWNNKMSNASFAFALFLLLDSFSLYVSIYLSTCLSICLSMYHYIYLYETVSTISRESSQYWAEEAYWLGFASLLIQSYQNGWMNTWMNESLNESGHVSWSESVPKRPRKAPGTPRLIKSNDTSMNESSDPSSSNQRNSNSKNDAINQSFYQAINQAITQSINPWVM